MYKVHGDTPDEKNIDLDMSQEPNIPSSYLV